MRTPVRFNAKPLAGQNQATVVFFLSGAPEKPVTHKNRIFEQIILNVIPCRWSGQSHRDCVPGDNGGHW